MAELSLGVPKPVLESVPDAESGAEQDVQRAVAGYERRIDQLIDSADDEAEAAGERHDVVEHVRDRSEPFDELVPELRACDQSPVHAIAWRNFCAGLVARPDEQDWLATQLDRERNARIMEDGIRHSDL